MRLPHTPQRAVSYRPSYAPLNWRPAFVGFGIAVAVSLPAAAQVATSTAAPVNLDLGSVLAAGNSGTPAALLATTPGTAPYEAPSAAPLNSSQPTSLVNQNTIQNNFVGSQSYADMAKLTPSVSNISPNGPACRRAMVRSFVVFRTASTT